MSPPKLVAHRGACLVAPENTFAAAEAAIARGAAMVEFDVRRTVDGAHVLMHDRDVARTTDGSGFVDALPASEIARLDAGAWFDPAFAGEPVPRLDAFLARLAGRAGAYCEVKRGDCEAIVREVRAAGMLDDVLFYAHKPHVRRALIEAAPEAKHNLPFAEVGNVAAARATVRRAVIEFTLEDADPAAMAEAREAGFEVMIYEPGDDAERLAKALSYSPELINIDALDRVAELVAL